ncbi:MULTISPECIES: H-type lectin domain-containing protein [unclassified Roseivivax]|uniref:H-type lectin domain-containing protein n=1 Tax=Roseivivax sp. GX 12232 TaxID=2900547 RepID=UPI001E4920B7|nr:H-type lectin domain-containing protein [Roseivivax sp. GX 12232]MCE0505657.1 H-type lectin domain-containing protein [Roseivivax sp. GX 12232]
MRRLNSNVIGIDQGEVEVFSDFASGGEMWTGEGARERRKRVRFSEPFRGSPAVQVGLSLWDIDSEANIRADLAADRIGPEGFDLVFRTWGDSRVARVRMTWTAIGELKGEDDWDLY